MYSSGSRVLVLASLAITTILLSPYALQSEELDLSIQQTNSALPISELHTGKKVFIVSHIIIKASPARVWDVLTDYDGASGIFSNLTRSKRAYKSLNKNGFTK